MKKNRKRIGFVQPDDNDEVTEKAAKIHPFETYVRANYAPTGMQETLEMYTSLELEYMLSEMFMVSQSKVVDILTALGYEMKPMDGEAVWMLYKVSNP